MATSPNIYYMAPDSNTPSWGQGIIYHHVLALNQLGYKASIIHEKKDFKIEWLDIKVPVVYWTKHFTLNPSDILVVPEVAVNFKGLKKLKCRKILFVQASSFLFEMMPDDETHVSLGFESAIGIMPHMMPIIEQFTGLQADMIPPFVAPYFLKEERLLDEREKSILIFPKFYQQDFGIVKRVISDRLKVINPSGLTSIFKSKWKLIVLKGKTHKEVAALMQNATFYIATNTFESFNASCVEAMAAGCISICYEGFGPRDYMKNGENAFVFPNNEAYRMCNFVFDLIDNFEQKQSMLKDVRKKGFELANSYNYEVTKSAVHEYYIKKVLQ